jgi:SAM-dependent methyltransferase
MLKEIAHFVRHAPEVLAMQKKYSRAEFADALNTKVDEQGFAEVRRELLEGLSGRVLEVGCGTGSMFRYYPGNVEIDAIEPEADFRELALAKAAASGGRVRAGAGDGMHLAFPGGTFDAVVLGLVLGWRSNRAALTRTRRSRRSRRPAMRRAGSHRRTRRERRIGSGRIPDRYAPR